VLDFKQSTLPPHTPMDAQHADHNPCKPSHIMLHPRSQAVQMWYDEISLYNFSRPGFSAATGHFTQIVWATSTQLGCAQVVGCGGCTHTVCRCGYLHHPPAVLQPLMIH
jgi:hypothetical protein